MKPARLQVPLQLACSICNPKLAKRAEEVFAAAYLPVQYQFHAEGTAGNEWLDVFGMYPVEKTVIISVLPKSRSREILQRLQQALQLGLSNTGIAFTVELTAASSLLAHESESKCEAENKQTEGGNEAMKESKAALVVAAVNQGYSEEVMDAAKTAGARGGTVVHARRLGDMEEAMRFWGVTVQAEKDLIMILCKAEQKLNIMKAIGKACGIHSEAQGVVLSLPVDDIVGFSEIANAT